MECGHLCSNCPRIGMYIFFYSWGFYKTSVTNKKKKKKNEYLIIIKA